VNLGVLYSFLGEHAKNVEEQRIALRLDPTLGSAYANLTNAYLSLNQFDKARQALGQAEARRVDNPLFWELRYELAFLAGNTADVERQVSVAMSHGEDGVLALQADTEAYYGHLAKAREFTRRASESARRNGDLESAIGYDVIGALREADFGNLQRARRQVATALAAGAEERSRVLSALVLARAGESSGGIGCRA
jgi:tetratricopeptide (TPR) repeat protein